MPKWFGRGKNPESGNEDPLFRANPDGDRGEETSFDALAAQGHEEQVKTLVEQIQQLSYWEDFAIELVDQVEIEGKSIKVRTPRTDDQDLATDYCRSYLMRHRIPKILEILGSASSVKNEAVQMIIRHIAKDASESLLNPGGSY